MEEGKEGKKKDVELSASLKIVMLYFHLAERIQNSIVCHNILYIN
jgi:hypothetical protein